MIVIENIEEFEKLGHNMQKKLQMDLIFQSLMRLYSQFIIIFHMNKLDYTIPELINILVTAEGTLKNLKGTVLTVKQTPSSERKSGWKKKSKPMKKQKKESKPKKVADKEKCFHCDANNH